MASLFLYRVFRGLAYDAVCLEASIDCYNCKAEEDDGCENVTDYIESLDPDLVAPANCLECAPETVGEVEPESSEPDDVENYNPPLTECGIEKNVRILSLSAGELSELHVSPEMSKVESKDSENDDSENEHVLGSPGLSFGFA